MKREGISTKTNDEVEYKLILLGDTSVGKTCLFKKITTGIFLDRNVSTVGIDRRTIKMECDFEDNGEKITKPITINLVDTAGEERFKAITKSYYKGSDGAVLLYDITERKTFEHVKEWIDSIKNSGSIADDKYSILLIGTKIDMIESGKKERQVETDEATCKCEEFNLEWGGECSNKDFTDQQYKEIFKKFVQAIYKKIGFKKFISQNIMKIEKKPEKRNNSQCPCIIF